jgi:Uma2 family endonuclease
MGMPLEVPLPSYTVDDVRAFPPDGCRYELVAGMLLVTPTPATRHQVVLFRLAVDIANYIGPDGPAITVSPGEIELQPSVHLEPDLLVYPARFGPDAAWTRISGWWLVVEVSGRDSRRYDRDFKRDAYLSLGVREVWQVDLDAKCILVSGGATRDARHADRLVWQPPEMAAPLVIDVPVLFRGVP